MDDLEAGEIRERLIRVEKRVWRYRIAVAVVGIIAVIGAGGWVFTPFETVQARAFQLVDASGHVRAVMETTGNGTGLILFDKAEKPQVALMALTSGTDFTLYDEAGTQRADLATSGDNVQQTFFDKSGQKRVRLDIGEFTEDFSLKDQSGNDRVALASGTDGAHFELYGKDGNSGETLEILGEKPFIELIDKNLHNLWQAP
ncbi:MAG: hypothetical protein ACREQI_02765 [Candidatus Binataceae bacterium]